MSRLKLRMIGLVTLINAVIGITLGVLLYTLFPAYYFAWYPSIPIFYWVCALILSNVLDNAKRNDPDNIVNLYMLIRIGKLFVAMLFMGAYVFLVGDNLKSFGLTLMLFYFIYLTLETYIFYLFEKRRMKNNGKRS